MKSSRRTLPISRGINTVPPSICLPQDPKDQKGVELLLGIATIVSKEIASSDTEIFDDGNDDDFLTRNKTSFSEPSVILDQTLTPKGPSNLPSSLIGDDDIAWHRARTVSIDNGYGSPRRSPVTGQTGRSKKNTKPLSLPAVVTPTGSRLRPVRKQTLKLLANKGKKEQIKFPKITAQQIHSHNSLPNIMAQHKRKAMEQIAIKGKSITIIHRKKFSWKNYPGESYKEARHLMLLNTPNRSCTHKCTLPSFRFMLSIIELEAFLVANREEYLRHSALNYTIQQKKYNNRLTERLLDLAAEHLYVFDEDEFSFVTVRDRIRCFYKSYVQSSKKRGIVLGYAARKAGILTPADLQKSARKEGTIVNPMEL
jgi:hypothetical protein